VQLLAEWNYRWFALSEKGSFHRLPPDDETYDASYVALPDERAEEFQRLLAEKQGRAFRRA
jgi:hypothetical protein